jgi:hypothetical protein
MITYRIKILSNISGTVNMELYLSACGLNTNQPILNNFCDSVSMELKALHIFHVSLSILNILFGSVNIKRKEY